MGKSLFQDLGQFLQLSAVSAERWISIILKLYPVYSYAVLYVNAGIEYAYSPVIN